MSAAKKVLSVITSVIIATASVSGIFTSVSADTGVGSDYVDKSPELTDDDYSEEKSFWKSMSFTYYYDQLSDNQKELYDRLDDACMYYLLNDEDIGANIQVDCADLLLTKDETYKAEYMFYLSNPQYFFLANGLGYGSTMTSDLTKNAHIQVFTELKSGEERASAKTEIKAVVSEYLEEANQYSLPEEKEHVICDRMCNLIEYDKAWEGTSNLMYEQSMYSAILGKTVCAGYSQLFTALINACGVECVAVTGSGHQWNVINLHGYWYYVDITNCDQDWGVYYYYYNRSTPYGKFSNVIDGYTPEVLFSNVTIEYTSKYFDQNGIKYFLVSTNPRNGLLVLPVSGDTSSLPFKVTYNDVEYSVIGAVARGWINDGNVWHYYDEEGNMVTGWNQIESIWYYFNDQGDMLTGWQKIEDLWYYFNSNGEMMKYWQKIDGSWYYFCGSGYMVKHWYKVGNDWYYFNASGVMQTGWQKINNVWYYFGDNGSMKNGWQKVGGLWYYFESDGHMITGWRLSGGYWYYFKDSGDMKTGWHSSGGTWYYLDSNGRMVTNVTLNIGGKDYIFDTNGKCTNP